MKYHTTQRRVLIGCYIVAIPTNAIYSVQSRKTEGLVATRFRIDGHHGLGWGGKVSVWTASPVPAILL